MLKKTIKPLALLFAIVMAFSCFSSLRFSAEESGIFTYILTGGSATLTGIDSTASGTITVPDTLGDCPVEIIDGAFSYNKKITSVILPDTVTTISPYSFAYCTNLKSITFSSALSSIGESAFYGCVSLENIELPDSVERLEAYAFSWCEKITRAKLSSSLYKIERGIFYGCSALAEIEIPNTISYIMQEAFDQTKYYNTQANWENGMLYLDSYLLSAKSTLSGTCEVKPGTRVIADGAFSACASITGVIIYEDIKAIGERAFYGCKALKDVYYSGTIEKRRKLDVGINNDYLSNATWHYEYDPNVKEYAPGDINGDDTVNNKDVLRLFKYLSGWEVEVAETTLDVDGNGSVNNGDLIRLFQYISGWNVKIYSKNVGQEFGGEDQGPVIIF